MRVHQNPGRTHSAEEMINYQKIFLCGEGTQEILKKKTLNVSLHSASLRTASHSEYPHAFDKSRG